MDMNTNRYEKPVQTPSWGADVANPDCVIIEQRMKSTAARCPIPQNVMMNNRTWPEDMNKNRYEKPVQTPSRGAEVANPDCITIEQRMTTTAARCPIPQNGMMNNRSWPKDMNKNRYEKPVQTPSRGAEVAKPDCVIIEQRMKTTAARCPIPQNGMMNNRTWPKDMNKNRYEKPVQTPSRGAEVANPDCVTIEKRMKTTAARCPIPQNGMMNNRSWPKDMNKNRYEKPVQTPYRGGRSGQTRLCYN